MSSSLLLFLFPVFLFYERRDGDRYFLHRMGTIYSFTRLSDGFLSPTPITNDRMMDDDEKSDGDLERIQEQEEIQGPVPQ